MVLPNQIASLSYRPSHGAAKTDISSATQLPTRWLDYTAVEVLYTSVADLEDLFQNHPARAVAMRRWTAAGGILCVKGLDENWNDLAKLDKLFPLKKAERWSTLDKWNPRIEAILSPKEQENEKEKVPSAGNEQEKVPIEGEEKEKVPSEGEEKVPSDGEDASVMSPQEAAAIRASEKKEQEERLKERLKEREAAAKALKSSRVSEFGMGLIMATTDPKMDYGSSWGIGNSPYQIEDPSRYGWEQRHGINYDSANDDFWNFLIPGVGFAPVWQFLALISLFVIGVGPVNYYLLKKWKRVPLLLLTVPAAAAVVTVCLVAYAFFADGLGVRVRMRSYTEIDQTTGEAVCWSRLSYYAGMAPSNGLTFHDDTAVYPYAAWAWGADETAHTHRETVWDGDKQKLTSGWLSPRTPTQFITVRARQTPARLNVQAAADGALQVKNLLGTRIQELVVVDAAGKIFLGRDIAADNVATLSARDPGSAQNAILDSLNKHEPRIPAEVMRARHEGNWGPRNSRFDYDYPRHTRSSALYVSQGTSRMENTIARLHGSLANDELEPRTYIAIVDRSPEVEVGLDSFRDEDSFHIIVGRW